jgi:hypothetical protein
MNAQAMAKIEHRAKSAEGKVRHRCSKDCETICASERKLAKTGAARRPESRRAAAVDFDELCEFVA